MPESELEFFIERMVSGDEVFSFNSHDTLRSYSGQLVLLKELAVIHLHDGDRRRTVSAVLEVDEDIQPLADSMLVTERSQAAETLISSALDHYYAGNDLYSDTAFNAYAGQCQDKAALRKIRQRAKSAR